MNKMNKFMITCFTLFLIGSVVFADNVVYDTNTYPFVSGTKATAADVNAAFDEVEASVNDNNTRITGLEASTLDLVSNIGGDIDLVAGSGITITPDDINDKITFFVGTDAITASHIAPNSVGNSEIIDGSIGAAEIAAGAVASSEVLDNSLTSADLATDSVYAAEIAAGAVGSSELATNAVSAVKMLDEAGVDYASGSRAIPTNNTTYNYIAGVSITCPTAGYVIIQGSCYLSVSHIYNSTNDLFRFGFSTTSTGSFFSNMTQVAVPTVSPTGTYKSPVSIHHVVAVSAGTKTYYFNVQRWYSNASSATAYSGHISALFVPSRY